MTLSRQNRRLVAAVGCLLALGVSAPAAGAEDAFARMTTLTGVLIPGDQPAIAGIANSKDTVQVFGTVLGIDSVVSLAGGAVGLGPVTARPAVITKRIDRASPRLLRSAFIQESINVDIIWVMTVAGVKKQSVSIRLEGAFITRIEANASLTGVDAANYEDVHLVYRKLIQTVPTIDATGAVTGTTITCLNVLSRTSSSTASC
jgi:type VI secretion system Hcp family effector